jgi:hypothetical protein
VGNSRRSSARMVSLATISFLGAVIFFMPGGEGARAM